MARPREFDRETALEHAIGAFAQHGYEGTSTETLLNTMQISRQSLYDTFGDKRRLYLAALQRYIADSVAEQIQALNSAASPLQGIAAALGVIVSRARPCLGISAVCEFGQSDLEIATVSDIAGRSLRLAFERRIAEAKAASEVGAGVNERSAAEFIVATCSGIKIAARGGASDETLRAIALMALRGLK